MKSDLVAQRPDRDALDDRQLAFGGDAVHVLRRHRGVVDDHAGGLRGRAPGGRADVVDRGRRESRQHRDVVQEREQAGAHGVTVNASAVMAPKVTRWPTAGTGGERSFSDTRRSDTR